MGRRTPPTDPEEIQRVVRFRDPFNHPTVVYRRSAVLAAGGYSVLAFADLGRWLLLLALVPALMLFRRSA